MARLSAAVRPAVLTEKDRHVVSRFSFGIGEQLVTEVRRTGSDRWFAQQLDPASVDDPYAPPTSWWPVLEHSPAQAWAKVRSGQYTAWKYGDSLVQHSLSYKISSRRQLREVMHDFWSNLLYVPAGEDRSFPWRFRYETALRARALTSYRELLRTAVVHPAMSCWLTNYDNTKDGINENLGRELLELFTVGRPAGYDETDVKDAARLLTGFRVRVFEDFAASYDPARHWTGRVRVLDFTHPNTAPDGRAAVGALLDHLALHPETARRVARRLCERFVSDQPSPQLVSAVARSYLDAGSRIRPVLQTLRSHPEFLASRRTRLRTPVEDVVATLRAVDARPRRPLGSKSLATSLPWIVKLVGQEHLGWPRPDGYPESSRAWASPARMLASWRMHYAVAGGWWGPEDQARPEKIASLPAQFPRTVAELTQHQSLMLLGRPADDQTVVAVAGVLRRARSYAFQRPADVTPWALAVIRGTVLNTPEGMLK